jgi:hypothetical protein
MRRALTKKSAVPAVITIPAALRRPHKRHFVSEDRPRPVPRTRSAQAFRGEELLSGSEKGRDKLVIGYPYFVRRTLVAIVNPKGRTTVDDQKH